ncbi:MAG: universal stress protein [bacterium]|nr:universal stress protein [bacterium]
MHKILVPLDGSDHSLKALHIACDLATKYDAHIFLLYVLPNDKLATDILDLTIARKFNPELQAKLTNIATQAPGPLSETLNETVGKQILKIAASRAKRVGVETQILAIATGDPAENILAARKLTGANTIVMGSRGVKRSTVSSFGSASNKVFANADCTCISVK